MPTGKPVSQTGALRLTEAEQHAQGHMVSNSGARLEERTQSSGSFHCTWWPPYQSMHRDKVRGSQEQTRYSSFKKQEVMKSRM